MRRVRPLPETAHDGSGPPVAPADATTAASRPAWSRPRLRLRTGPLPSGHSTPYPTEERWASACPLCDFAVDTGTRPEVLRLLVRHAAETGHADPPVRATFVVPRGSGPDPAVSRMSLRIERRR